MGRKKTTKESELKKVQRWFAKSVACEGESYVMDDEQVAAVMDQSENAIVVARAGSGKTRTIVAKIVYLVAKCGVKPDEIMAFVFNANAAEEINVRLGKMTVDGAPAMGEGKVRVASTFHAFSRKVVFDVCGGREKCGKILAGEKERFVLAIVNGMMKEPKWRDRIRRFVSGGNLECEVGEEYAEDINGVGGKGILKKEIDERDLYRFVKMMALFVNRAQQKFLAGENTLRNSIRERYREGGVGVREKDFIQLGAECYRRYHWYLLDVRAKAKLGVLDEYGTDFNLIVSWASKLIVGGEEAVRELLEDKKYILIDEYQDFSQLFLSVVLAIRALVPEVRLFVVGDDLQAINRFAGSDVEYFREFEKYFPKDVRRLTIATNYRCNYMIVNTARKFMVKAMGEWGDFRAFSRRAGKVILVDPRETACSYALVEHDVRVSGRDRVYMEMVRKMIGRMPKSGTVRYMKTLVKVIRKNKKANEILILHRNNETNLEGVSLTDLARGLKWGLMEFGVMTATEFDEKIRIMTMHKSKGLEAEVVIILEADEGVIPKIHPDMRLYTIFGETEEVALLDQKRLFYVAMTRAKKRLYIIHDATSGKGFIKYLGEGLERWEE